MSSLYLQRDIRPLGLTAEVLSLGKLYFYLTGTLTSTPVYDAGGNVITQPLVADITGKFPDAFLDDGITYRVILQTSTGVEVDDIDPYPNASLNSLTFSETGTGAVAIPLSELLGSEWINALSYIPEALRANVIAGTNTTSLTTYLQAALDAGKSQGRNIFFPKGRYKTGALTWQVTSYYSYFAGLGSGPGIIGMGPGNTVFEMTAASAYLFNLSADTTSKFVFGTRMTGFSVIPTGAVPANCGGIKLTSAINAEFDNVHFVGLSGTAFKITDTSGDPDSTASVILRRCRMDNCAGWGIDATADIGHNEISSLYLEQVSIQGCGTTSNKTITAITQANPAVVTSTAHGLTNGTVINIFGVVGMEVINDRRFTVAGVTANTFQLSGIDSSAYGMYSSGGSAAHYSGGMIWKGQVCTTNQCTFTLNNNVALFVPGEAGIAVQLGLNGTAFENNLSRHIAVGGIDDFKARQIQLFNNDTYPATVMAEWNASLLAIQKLQIDGVVVRATSGNNPITAFKFTPASSLALNGARITGVVWENFGYSGQVGFDGFTFDAVPFNCKIFTDTTHAFLMPVAWEQGNKMPYRQGWGGSSTTTFPTGAWVELNIPSAGLSISNSGIGNTQTRNIYLYDNNNVPSLEVSTTAPVLDANSGYQVKTGSVNKLWVGRAATDGAGLYLVGVAANWCNPTYINGSWQWANASGNAFMKAGDGTFASLPASDADGVKIGGQ